MGYVSSQEGQSTHIVHGETRWNQHNVQALQPMKNHFPLDIGGQETQDFLHQAGTRYGGCCIDPDLVTEKQPYQTTIQSRYSVSNHITYTPWN